LKQLLSTTVFFLSSFLLSAQVSGIAGLVYDEVNKESLPGAVVSIEGLELSTTTDESGNFQIEVEPGLYNLWVNFSGYRIEVQHEVRVIGNKMLRLEIAMTRLQKELSEVVVRSEAFHKTAESPLSMKNLNVNEIRRMPGSNLDISKAIQTLPGVVPKVSFGYNLIVRGGSSSENAYYLDGIEIPTITHFTVQGANGGPAGIVNSDFLRSTDLHSSAFPSARGNALSSVLEMEQREGREDRLGLRATISASEAGIMLEGPLGKKSNFIASARKSYTEYLLRTLNVPVLPAYTDFQFRNKIRLDSKNELTLLALVSNDVYTLNYDAEASDVLLYNLGYIPEGTQRTYTIGANYKHYLKKSYYNVILSTSTFDNKAEKFRGNSGEEADRLLDYHGIERDIHARFEFNYFSDLVNLKYGLNADNKSFDLGHRAQVYIFDAQSQIVVVQQLSFQRYGGFINADKALLRKRLLLSAGIRMDANNFNKKMGNPIDQISPRFSASFDLTEKSSLNLAAGTFYQLPSVVLMAHQGLGFLGSQDSLKYMRSDQVSFGFEHKNGQNYRVSLEGFYKRYSDYPFLLSDNISFANAQAEYVAVGTQPSASISEGRAYGVELYIQQKLKKNYWWMTSYTYSVSEFKDRLGAFQPSSWDSRHYLNALFGKRWGKGWQVGLRFSYASGTPYTPYNTEISSLKANWEVFNRGIFDYSQINQSRLPDFHRLDIRLDKEWNFEKWNLSAFIDLQNLYRSPIRSIPYLTVQRDDQFQPISDPTDPSRYLVEEVDSDTGRLLYGIGLIAEF
jgi:hypothetical protein